MHGGRGGGHDEPAIQLDDVRTDPRDDLAGDATPPTTLSRVAIELTEASEGGVRTQSRAEAIIELIVKSDRVFLDGACWRCTERTPVAESDLGLCADCLRDLKTTR